MNNEKDTIYYLKVIGKGCLNFVLWFILGIISGLWGLFWSMVHAIANWITQILNSAWQKSNDRIANYLGKVFAGIILTILFALAAGFGK